VPSTAPPIANRVLTKAKPGGQGDQRDAIIISIGYGKDRAGNLPQRFGPLLPEGGRRRLNMAVTRARQKVTVASWFSHLDLDWTRVRSRSGAELPRNYRQYVSANGKGPGDAETTGEPGPFAEAASIIPGKVPWSGFEH